MADVTLSAAVRSSLLSLQNTTNLVERTQGRLSSGLKVGSAIDDPVSFFQAKTLSDRAFDFNEKKDGIDQGVSTVTAAIDGLDAVESLVRQLKGLAQSLKSATGSQFTDLITQYNDLRSQVDLLTADATYQGVNLINGTGQTLTTEFSDLSTSKLSIASVDVRNDGLNVISLTNLTAGSTAGFNYDVLAAGTISNGTTISVTYVGDTTLLTNGATQAFTYGTSTLTIGAETTGSGTNLVHGTTYTFTLGSVGSTQGGTGGATGVTATAVTIAGNSPVTTTAQAGKLYVQSGTTTTVDQVLTDLSTALTTLRSNASSLGSNVALLQTRLDFTAKYVDTLDSGSGKLTLADINEEGANLLALQTRQQLGIQSLSFAGQAEQAVLGLFR